MGASSVITQQKHVFLSYRSNDVEFALKLAADLKNAGLSLWIDRLDIRPGDDWRQALADAVNVCAAMICLVTPDYVESDYCRRELGRAGRLQRRRIPLRLREVADDKWPLELESEHFLDFSGWRDEAIYADRLAALLRLLREDFAEQFRPVPDAETQYLTRLIAELEASKSVMELFELAHQAERLLSDELLLPEPRYPGAWMLAGSYLVMPDDDRVLPDERRAFNWDMPLDGIAAAIERYPRFVLIGAPGAGKTTTIQHLVLTAAHARLRARNAACLPLYLKLAMWNDGDSPEAFIRHHWPLESDPIELLARGEMSLYLDGLSEIGPSGAAKVEQLRAWLNSERAPRCVIVTCRSAEYDDTLKLPLPVVQATEMDKSRIEQFVVNYVGAEAAERLLSKILPDDAHSGENARHLFQLARNPFLLSVLVLVFTRSPDGKLPQNKGTLLKQLVAELWRQEALIQPETALDFESFENALANLAFAMIDQSMPVYVPCDFALHYTGDPELLQAATRGRFLEEQSGTVRFSHQLMQEYFAALGLARVGLATRMAQPQFDELGRRIAGKWDPVIVALCGSERNPDAAVRAVAEVDTLLALECISSGIGVTGATRELIISQALSEVQSRRHEGRLDIARALMAFDHEMVLPILLEAMRDGPWEARRLACRLVLEREPLKIEGLEAALLDRELDIRDALGTGLRQIGADSLPHLFQLLRDDDWMLRRAAAWALGELRDAAAAPALTEALTDADHLVAVKAIEALGAIQDAATVPALLDVLRHADWRLGRAAATALGWLGLPALPGLLAAAGCDDEDIRWRAVAGLKHISDPAAVSALLEATHDPSLDVRAAAIEALRDTEDVKAVNRLIELLKDTSAVRWAKERICDLSARILSAARLRKARAAADQWRVQQAPVAAFASAGASSGKHSAAAGKDRLMTDKLAGTPSAGSAGEFDDLDSPDWMRRRRAVWHLATVGVDIALPKLIVKLSDKDCQVRLAAVQVLGDIDNETAVEHLITALGDVEAGVCDAAAEALVKRGAKAIPGLLKALESQNVSVRGAAIEALGQIADKSAVQALVKHLEDVERPWLAEQRICDLAARALLSIGTSEARRIVKEWQETAAGRLFSSQSTAQKAVEAPEPAEDRLTERVDNDPLVALLDALHDPEWGTREEAGKKLRQYARDLKGKEASRDIQRLIGATEDDDWVVRWAASEALAWAGDISAVPHLIERLEDENWMVRIAAVRGLLELQERSALPAIMNLAADENHNVREAAAEAMGELGDAGAVEALTQMAQDEERFVRFAAVEALGKLAQANTTPMLIAALQDRDAHVRWIAVEALSKLGDASAVTELIGLLDDSEGPQWEEKRICDVAAAALEAIGTTEAKAAVEQWRSSQPEFE